MRQLLELSSPAGMRRLLAALCTATFLAAPALAETPAAPASPEAPAGPAAPKQMEGQPAVNITPTAGVWRDRLRDARRRVLEATAQLDDVNAEYARVLYEHGDDAELIKSHHAKRQAAQAKLQEARQAVPPLVEAARKDGVSPRVLELYEQATLN